MSCAEDYVSPLEYNKVNNDEFLLLDIDKANFQKQGWANVCVCVCVCVFCVYGNGSQDLVTCIILTIRKRF